MYCIYCLIVNHGAHIRVLACKRRDVIWAGWPRAGRAPGPVQCKTMRRGVAGGLPVAERLGRLPYEPKSKQTHCQVVLLLLQGGSLIAVWIISSFVVVKDCVDARHCEETKLKLHLCAKKAWECIYIPALPWDSYSKHNINHYVKIKKNLWSLQCTWHKNTQSMLSRIANTWCSSRSSAVCYLLLMYGAFALATGLSSSVWCFPSTQPEYWVRKSLKPYHWFRETFSSSSTCFTVLS